MEGLSQVLGKLKMGEHYCRSLHNCQYYGPRFPRRELWCHIREVYLKMILILLIM